MGAGVVAGGVAGAGVAGDGSGFAEPFISTFSPVAGAAPTGVAIGTLSVECPGIGMAIGTPLGPVEAAGGVLPVKSAGDAIVRPPDGMDGCSVPLGRGASGNPSEVEGVGEGGGSVSLAIGIEEAAFDDGTGAGCSAGAGSTPRAAWLLPETERGCSFAVIVLIQSPISSFQMKIANTSISRKQMMPIVRSWPRRAWRSSSGDERTGTKGTCKKGRVSVPPLLLPCPAPASTSPMPSIEARSTSAVSVRC